MRRISKIMLCMVMILILGMISGCAVNNKESMAADDGKIHVMCTTFPIYDWTRQIVGEDNEDVEVTLLLDNGTDMHSYQASAMDVAEISSCDILIYVGGESEKWVDDIVKDAVNQDMKVIRLLNVLGENVHEEEIIEGMQEENHEEEHAEDGKEESEEAEYDEHVWLSLKNAGILCETIKNVLCEADSPNADTYEAHYAEYSAQLKELDTRYEKMTGTSARKTILFGDRFPFRYLTEDYRIRYYAAFPGCSAETEASFETVAYLAKKMDEENLPAILVIENSDKKLAQTILSNTADKNREILVMDSMQSVGKEEMKNGVTYLSIMEENYETLSKALN